MSYFHSWAHSPFFQRAESQTPDGKRNSDDTICNTLCFDRLYRLSSTLTRLRLLQTRIDRNRRRAMPDRVRIAAQSPPLPSTIVAGENHPSKPVRRAALFSASTAKPLAGRRISSGVNHGSRHNGVQTLLDDKAFLNHRHIMVADNHAARGSNGVFVRIGYAHARVPGNVCWRKFRPCDVASRQW